MSGVDETLNNWELFTRHIERKLHNTTQKAILRHIRENPFEINDINPDELFNDILPVFELSDEELIKLVEFITYFRIVANVIWFDITLSETSEESENFEL